MLRISVQGVLSATRLKQEAGRRWHTELRLKSPQLFSLFCILLAVVGLRNVPNVAKCSEVGVQSQSVQLRETICLYPMFVFRLQCEP